MPVFGYGGGPFVLKVCSLTPELPNEAKMKGFG